MRSEVTILTNLVFSSLFKLPRFFAGRGLEDESGDA